MPKHYASRLAAALRAGHGAEKLYDEYGIALFGYCWALLGERAEAAGALTDTVLVAAAHADALADPGDLTPWVFALARTECLRRQADVPPLVSPYQCDPDADVITMLVARALTGARPADRELIDLTVRHGLAGRDLARVIGEDDDERAAERAKAAVTRFDQTLSTLFMASPGRLAVPREIIADRPPLRVLLDLLPPPRPPGELRGNIAATCADPAMDHYRQMVARRALPLREDGFPRPPHPERAGPQGLSGMRTGPGPFGARPGSYGVGTRSGARDSGTSGTPSGTGTRSGPYGRSTPRGSSGADTPVASYGTAAMPLGAPVATPEDAPPARRSGGRPGVGPVAPDVIPVEAVSRARTSAPPPDPPEAREPDRQAGERAGHAAAHAADRPSARERHERRRPRPSPARRFGRAVGVVVAVLSVAGAVWAAGQIFAATRSPGPRVMPSATTSGGGTAPIPPAGAPTPSKHARNSPADATPVRTGPPTPARARHHRSGEAGSPTGIGVGTVSQPRLPPPPARHSASPTHTKTTPTHSPTTSPTNKDDTPGT